MTPAMMATISGVESEVPASAEMRIGVGEDWRARSVELELGLEGVDEGRRVWRARVLFVGVGVGKW